MKTLNDDLNRKKIFNIGSPQSKHSSFMSLKIVIDDQIKKLFDDHPELKSVKKDRFEIAVANFVNLKYLHGLDNEDLIDGIMGDGGDEGIDLCYLFCNGILIKDGNQPINSESVIKAKFFQTKKEDGYSTDGFRKLKEGIEEIFNLDLPLDSLKVIGANEDILETADLIRKIFRRSQTERANFFCEVFYVTIAAPDVVISEKIKHLEQELKNNALSIPFKFEYWGGQKLIDLNKKDTELLEIKFESQHLDILEKGVDTSGFAGFVKGNDLMVSLIDEEGQFKSHLTEGNIRFFLGEDKAINKSIIDSAMDKTKAVIFWAMNNGITIIGDSIKPLGSQSYSITNPQIVNGCQTIHCLHIAYQNGNNRLSEGLKVFIKLIKTENLNTQTDIISATNSQNSVKSASLKVNDTIQKNLEDYLKKHGIFYERRENFYKRQGYKGNDVIGLLKMAQIIHTVVNKEAILAINDTATLFDTPIKYNLIFNDHADYDLYVFAIKLYQEIWTIKNSDLRNNQYEKEERDLISKGGLVFLHIMSSLLISKAEFIEQGKKRIVKYTGNIIIRAKKNEFVKRKNWLLKKLEDEPYIEEMYEIAKTILKNAAKKYSIDTEKTITSLFKNRSFDKDYLRPFINKYLEKKKNNN